MVKQLKTYCFRLMLGPPVVPKGPRCGSNLSGCHLKLSEVRPGSFKIDLEPVWGPLGPKPAPNGPRPNLGQLKGQVFLEAWGAKTKKTHI